MTEGTAGGGVKTGLHVFHLFPSVIALKGLERGESTILVPATVVLGTTGAIANHRCRYALEAYWWLPS